MSKFFHLFKYFIIFVVFLSLSSFSIAFAETVEELEKKINALADEIDELKLEAKSPKERVHLFGYGELHYNNNFGNDGLKRTPSKDVMNFHRFVIGLAIDFADKIKFSSEVDFENGFADPYIEFAYLDFLFSEQFNIRAGSLITPVGYINETHEPPTFYSVERPYTDRLIMPTTWPEGGAGIFGDIVPGLSYKLYGQASLTSADGKKFFQAKNGLRKGRYKAKKALANDIAVVGRLEYTGFPGLSVGASLYRGDTTQNVTGIGSGAVTLWDVDTRYRFRDVELRGMYVQYNVSDAGAINTTNLANGKIKSASDGVGSRGVGWRVELAYHLGELLFGKGRSVHEHAEEWYHPGALKDWQVPTEMDLVPFIRYEQINTQDKMPSGFTANPKYDRNVFTFGAAFFPHKDIVVKADLEMWKSGDSAFDYNQFNLGLGYMF